jgi:calcium-dependent protein kinase
MGDDKAHVNRSGFMLDHSNDGKTITAEYNIERKTIGTGTYGMVAKGVHKITRAVRAVKTIQKTRLKGQNKVQQFRQEIQIMKEMDHPNILKLYETYEDRNNIYLVLELCKGGELFDRIADRGTGLTEELAAEYMKQILQALYYMHTAGVMHRDLKPENFLLFGPKDEDPLKVIDFGLATHFDTTKRDPKKTRAGTPYYVSPQVLTDVYTEKCDVWSAGVICYILLCGYPPFYGDSDGEIMAMVKKAYFTFPSPEWTHVSTDAKELIEAMLTLKEEDRISAEGALHHKWIQRTAQKAPEIGPEIAKRIVKNFQNFQGQSRLKKVAMTLIAQHLQEDKIDELKDIFKGIDKNDDGTLTYSEIKEGLAKSDSTLGRNLEVALAEIDSDASGVIEYTEFLAAAMERKLYIQRDVCWNAFQVFDLNSDGVITKEELHKVLSASEVTDSFPMSTVEAMIKEVDQNGDGHVDFDEFFQMMTSKTGYLSSAIDDAAARKIAAGD